MKKLISMALVLFMLLSALPMSAFALDEPAQSSNATDTEKYFNVISRKDYTLAPGATESTIILNDATGANQNIGYAIEVDLSNPAVTLMSGYSNMDPSYWIQQTTSMQCAAAEEKLGVNVIGAINTNLSWASNEPIGMLVINGEVYHEASGSNYFVLTKDGKAEIREANEPLRGNEWQATSTFGLLVKDGVTLYPAEDHAGLSRAPRTAIGIKADGNVVLYVVDGRQAPKSAGMTLHELAQTMIDMGCVDAVNCDGGGTSTIVTEREGSGELSVKNVPSDGSERPTLGTLMVISTAKPDGEFHHASIEPKDELYTPGSKVQFTVTGVDSAGGVAPLPEDGAWAIDATSSDMGTIDPQTGIFTANADAEGEVKVQYISGGATVGSASIDLVKPDSIVFLNDEMSLGFEESSDLNIIVKYKGVEVNYKPTDILWELSNAEMGTFADGIFTSSDGKTINGTVTATSAFDETVNSTMKLIIGMLPTIVWDFEDYVDPETGEEIPAKEYYTIDAGEGTKFTTSNYNKGGVQSAEIVSIDDQEPVRMGNYSLKLNYDFRNCGAVTEGAIFGTTEGFVVPGMPTAIGVWVYAPEGTGIKWEGDGTVSGLWLRGYIKNADGTNTPYDFTFEPKVFTGDSSNWPDEYPGIWWEGWHYCEADLTKIPGPYTLAAGAALRLMFVNGTMMGERTAGSIYLDNFQFVYGTNVDDVDSPAVNQMTFNTTGLTTDEKDITDGMTINSNTVNFHTSIYDIENKYTSDLDIDTVRVYIDGISTFNNEDYQVNTNPQGDVWVSNVELLDGYHTITLSAKDKAGNELNETKSFYINGGAVSDTTVSIVPQETGASLGGIVNIDVVASDADDLANITLGFKLHSYFKEYSVEFSENYEGTYSYNKLTKVITINATRKTEATADSDVIATLSVHVPADLKLTDEFTYTVCSGAYDTVAGNYRTFVTPMESMGINAAYFPSSGIIIAGTDCTITVVDTNDAPAVNVGVYLEDGTLLGNTDENGQLVLQGFGTTAGTYKVYAQDEIGARSFIYNVDTYAAQGDVTGTPYSIMNNAVSDYTTQNSITWMSNPLVDAVQVLKYAPIGSEEWVTVNAVTNLTTYVSGGNKIVNVNNATIIGLTPNTTYRYVVGGGEIWSAEATFTTGDGDTRGTDKFFVIGDIQAEDMTNINAILGNVCKDNYQFGIQTGDAVDDGGNYQYWMDIAGILGADKLGNADLISVLGNHEFAGDATAHNAKVMYNLPVEGYGAYYSMTYGNVYVAVINYTSTKSELNRALAWLVEDANASTATWKVLAMHQPAYYTNIVGGNAEIHDVVPAAVDAAGIDFVFSGHDHSYARTAPLTGGNIDYENGAVYFICGSSGEKSYEVTINPEFNFENTSDSYNAIYMSIEATKWSFTVTTYNVAADGTKMAIDTYTSYIPTDFCENDEHSDYTYEDGYITCSKCEYEVEFSQFSGFYKNDGSYYYAINGNNVSGWYFIDNDWYYFYPDTFAAKAGPLSTFTGVTYEIEENGRLKDGVWVKTLYGTRYYYGPDFYKNTWVEIDGNLYRFTDSYRLEGYRMFYHTVNGCVWYNFGDDGICRDEIIPDGFYYNGNLGYSYVKDGKSLIGLNKIDGDYYYFNYMGYAQKGKVDAGVTNCELSPGHYYFGEDYKALNGIVNGAYYVNGKPKAAGLIEIDGDLYFAGGANGEISINKKQYVWQGNGILPEGNYYFGADGKMLMGIVDGVYYINGQPKTAGLVEVDGDFYFASGNGEIVTGDYYVWQGNGILPEGIYTFGADGKMLDGIAEIDGKLCYYENGRPKMAGLVKVGEYYYFASGANGELITDRFYYAWKTSCDLPNGTNYQFGADGKMLDGIVEVDGRLCYYENGKPKMAGLIKVGNDYYFASGANGELITDRFYYAWKTSCDLPNGTSYQFGADGKMFDGIVEVDGKLCYYENGKPKMAGLIKLGNDYYFAGGTKGELIVDRNYYAWATSCDLPMGKNYEFGADGKMLDGIVEVDGKLCYYVLGAPKMAGLLEIDGAYYFAGGSNGEITVNKTYYVWQGNGILPEASYEFGADGKILDGFIEKVDGIYYYEMGKTGKIGLNFIDGYYYFINYGGKIVTNQTYYVWEGNGYTVPMNYTFDAMGRIILD